jgi:fibronectin type 3 domain-containing protein
LFSTPLNALTFDDSTVTSGDTYYYVVTAVDNDGVESLYSNQATANVPAS